MRPKADVFKVPVFIHYGDLPLKLCIGLRGRRVQGSGYGGRLKVAYLSLPTPRGSRVPGFARGPSPAP